DLRVIAPQPAQQFEQEAVAGGHRAVEADFALQDARLLKQPVADLVPARQHLAGPAQEGLALAGEGHRAVVAVEQRGARDGFQLADAAAQRGGADVAGGAGPAEVQGLGQLHELPQLPEIHALVLHKTAYAIANISFYATPGR